MYEEKKQYLSKYILQEPKINRLKIMIINDPQNKENYEKEIIKSKRIRLEIEEKIGAMEDELLAEILFQKYIFGLNLEEVGYAINYSKRQTERLHRKALEKFQL